MIKASMNGINGRAPGRPKRLCFPDLDFSLYFYAYTDVETPDDAAPQPERADWQGGLSTCH